MGADRRLCPVLPGVPSAVPSAGEAGGTADDAPRETGTARKKKTAHVISPVSSRLRNVAVVRSRRPQGKGGGPFPFAGEGVLRPVRTFPGGEIVDLS